VTGFNVYRQLQSGGACATPNSGTYSRVNTSAVTAYAFSDADASLVPSSTYCYAVTALGTGGAEGAFSSATAALIPSP